MNTLKNILGALLVLLGLGTSAQNFTFSHGTETYESIVGTGERWENFLMGKHAFPADFFIKEFGTIDSIKFGFSNLILYSNQNQGEFTILCNNRNDVGDFPSSSDVWYDVITENGDDVLVIEFRVQYPNFPERQGQYQVRFYKESGNIRYHYDQPGFDPEEGEEIAIGLNQQSTEPSYFMYLKGNPESPSVATAVPELGYLDSFPAPNTYYQFSASGLSIGDKEVLAKTAVQETERGFRVLSRELDIEAQLLTLDGKTLALGENYNSEFTFLTPKSSLQPGIYLVRITNTQTGKAATVKVYRD